MADSVALQIADAFEAALNVASVTVANGTITKPLGLTVHRNRLRPTQADAGLTMVVYRLSAPDPLDSDRVDLVDWIQPMAVEVRKQLSDPATTAPDDQMDGPYAWALAAIMNDPTFGGLANDTTIGQLQISYEEAGTAIAVWYQAFNVQYQTLRNDPRYST